MERLEIQLARLTTMSSAALRAEWRQLTSALPLTSPPTCSGVALPGSPLPSCARSSGWMREVARTGEAVTRPATRIKPGTRLVRDWGGDSHHVLVLEEGFLYRDERYRSLTTIAHIITGARWSGPRFFGLTAGKEVADA
jgi:hypothetical protein